MRSWASDLNSLDLSLLFCRMGIIIFTLESGSENQRQSVVCLPEFALLWPHMDLRSWITIRKTIREMESEQGNLDELNVSQKYQVWSSLFTIGMVSRLSCTFMSILGGEMILPPSKLISFKYSFNCFKKVEWRELNSLHVQNKENTKIFWNGQLLWRHMKISWSYIIS